MHRVGVKDTPETIEKRRATRLATEQARREQGIHYIWITDGKDEHKIQVGEPLPEGYDVGRKPSFAENARTNRKGETRDETAKANMSASASAAWADPAKRAAMTSARRPFRWVTNGETDAKFFEGDTLLTGWRFGRTRGCGKARSDTTTIGTATDDREALGLFVHADFSSIAQDANDHVSFKVFVPRDEN